jgi:PAS domain S-box-containing protein
MSLARRKLAPDSTIAPDSAALRALIDNLPLAVLEQGEDGRVCRVGGSLEPIFGRPGEALIGAQLKDLLLPEDRQTFAQLISSAGKSTRLTGELTVLQPNGTKIPCEVSLQANRSDPRSSICAVFRDISARRALEAELRRAQQIAAERERLATIGQLTAGVAHEINNPLAYVKGNLGSMRELVAGLQERLQPGSELGPTAEELAEIVRECLEGVNRVAAIVQALKGMSRHRPNERVRFDPGRAAAEAVMVFQGAKQGSCHISCELPSLPYVLGSPGALSQVILNLLENGLDAMRGEGALVLRGEADDHRVRLSVADSGSGIPPEVGRRIYEPFFTTKEVGKGTGLGLYICHQLIELMGGQICYRSGATGTTFTVELPIAI